MSPSPVAAIPAASSLAAEAHFMRRLSLETDCADVHAAMCAAGGVPPDFVLLDVRGPAAYAHDHVPGALNVPYGSIDAARMSEWPVEMLFVVYCAGPHCNGGDRAALRLAQLGRRVKLMIGGVTGWAAEGFPFVSGVAPGRLTQ